MYTILLADDERLEREAIYYIIKKNRSEQFEILESDNGIDTLKLMSEKKPDLTILDIQMPGLNGIEILKRARARGYQKRVLFLTAYDKFSYAVSAIKFQAQDYIVKPVVEKELIELLDRMTDELDAEIIDQKMKEKKAVLIQNMEKIFLKKMLMGEIDEEVMEFMNIQGISYDASGNCMCLKIMKEIPEESCQKLQSLIKSKLQQLQYFVLSNLQNSMLTLVYFTQDNYLADDTEVIENMISKCVQDTKIPFQIEMGTGFEELSGLEECYDEARECFGDVKKKQKENKTDHDVENGIPQELIHVREYIDNNYNQKITLEELAEVAGFTKYYLSRVFKKYFAETIMDYVMKIRIEKAKELLENSDMSVKQIGGMVGFSESNYFIWTFKKMVDSTPLKYRQSCIQERNRKSEWNF